MELQKFIDEIPELLKLHWRTPNEDVWTNKVLRYLKKQFGEETDYYKQFHHKVYDGGGIVVTSTTPDSYFQNNRDARLQEYKLLLESFLDEVDQSEEHEKNSSTHDDFSLRLEPEHLIAKFKACLKELDDLLNPKFDELHKSIFGEETLINEPKLLDISKKIRNLLKVGYTDGKERSEQYTIEGGNFYKSINRERQPFERVKDVPRKIFLQHAYWHKTKIKEYLNELELIKEAIDKSHTKTEPKTYELYLKMDDYPEPFYRTLVERINHLYYYDFFPESLLLIRKLFENLVIDILKKKYPDETDLYIGVNRKHHKFHIIIKNLNRKIDNGDFDNSKSELLEAIIWASKLRDEGGKTSHSITFNVDKPYLDQIAQQVKRNTDLLIRVFNLIK